MWCSSFTVLFQKSTSFCSAGILCCAPVLQSYAKSGGHRAAVEWVRPVESLATIRRELPAVLQSGQQRTSDVTRLYQLYTVSCVSLHAYICICSKCLRRFSRHPFLEPNFVPSPLVKWPIFSPNWMKISDLKHPKLSLIIHHNYTDTLGIYNKMNISGLCYSNHKRCTV